MDHKPHECSQTWQVLRSEFDKLMLDNAREHGVKVHEGVRVLEVLFEGERAVGVKMQEEDGTQREVRAKVVVDASGQSRLIASRFKLRVVDPDAEEGRPVDLLRRGLSRHGQGRRRHAGAADQGQERAGSGTSRCTTTSSAWASSPRSTTCSTRSAATTTRRSTTRSWTTVPACRERVSVGRRVAGFYATKDYSYRADASAPATAGCWSATPSAFSIRSTPRACCWRSRAGRWRPTPSSKACKQGDFSAAQLGKWGPDFNEGMDRMRRLVCEFYDGFSFGGFVKKHPQPEGASDRPVDRRPVQGRSRRSDQAHERVPRRDASAGGGVR